MQWYERLDEKIRDYLPDMTVERDVPMSRHTSFRIGGPARRMTFPESREQLVILLGLAGGVRHPAVSAGPGHQSAGVGPGA